MSGSSIPYHLRTNKAVDRQIFLDLLKKVSQENPLDNYKYISLGGPMLEDFRQIHTELGLINLESIEVDAGVIDRQLFNKPFSCISCVESSTSDYITNFNRIGPTIFWLDYTNLDLSEQFRDCEALLRQLTNLDILKITFNVNPEVICPHGRVEEYRSVVSDEYMYPDLGDIDINTMSSLPITVSKTIKMIYDKVFEGEDFSANPLTLFRYIDNRHQMLTATLILMPDNDQEIESLISKLGLSQWPFLVSDWEDVHEIKVPDLTQKEKMLINQFVPGRSAEDIFAAIGFKLCPGRSRETKKLLENYIKYYRYIPNFQRLAI